MLSPLAQAVLALAIAKAPPGRSPYSLEAMPECGQNPRAAACAVTAFCNDGSPQCRAPRWSAARGAWVRMETSDTALRRYAGVADAIAATATRLVECRDRNGKRIAPCDAVDWSSNKRTLAIAALTVAYHESGLREDIQFGHPPLGRGPAGEVCLVQLALDQAPRYASWLSEAERERIVGSRKEQERFGRTLLGNSDEALEHCFEIGMRMLVRSRNACARAGVSWDFGMFSMYGSGATCRAPAVGKSRTKTFQTFLASKSDLAESVRKRLGLE